MRSVPFTLLLLVMTVAVALAAALRFSEGSLERFFGSPEAATGDYLYRFNPQDIHRIRLSGNGVQVECVFDKGVWRVVKPWQDRMDPAAADGILNFTLGTRVVDVIPEGKIDTAKAGLRDGTIGIRIEDKDGKSLATYLLGRRTEWLHRDPENKTETPTVFLQPQDDGNGGQIYAATGDIHFLFRDGLRHLRDHHPFFFSPAALQSVRIQSGDSDMVLSRTGDQAPWMITKPLERRSDPAAVRKLISDLYNFRAVKIADRSEVTLPADDAPGRQRFGLLHFGQKEETVVEIMPPATPEAETVYATSSDRPGTVFELRLKPAAPTLAANGTPIPVPAEDLVSVAGLPDTVNELRDPRLTDLMVTNKQGEEILMDIAGILISSSTGPEIALARPPRARWQIRGPGGEMLPVNEFAMSRLLKALSTARATGFPTDAAVDLAPYGLDRPSLRVRVLLRDERLVDMNFGQARDGVWYAMHAGVPTVMRLEDSFISQIPAQSWEWRLTEIWNLSPVDVAFIERAIEGTPTLQLQYNWAAETWNARDGDRDRTAEIDLDRANRLLELLTRLSCDTWLPADHIAANAALARPAMRLTIGVHIRGADGERSGLARRELLIAPASDSPNNRFFFGRINGDPMPFRIDPDVVRRLAVDVFGED